MDPWQWVLVVLVPIVTAVLGWVVNGLKYGLDRRKVLGDLAQKQEELDLAIKNADTSEQRAKEEADRRLLDQAMELCRGDEKAADQGRALLLAMARMSDPHPRVEALIDEVNKLENGRTIAQIRGVDASGELVDVVEEVPAGDEVAVAEEVDQETVPRDTDAEEGDDGSDDPEATGDQGDPASGQGGSGHPGS